MGIPGACHAALFAMLVTSHGFADEGRIPLIRPGTITAPGTYIITKDIEALSGPVFRVTVTDVTIDLNGHTLRRSGLPGSVIEVNGLASSERRITIVNGHLAGGGIGGTLALAAPRSAAGRALGRFANLVITEGGITFDPCWEIEILAS